MNKRKENWHRSEFQLPLHIHTYIHLHLHLHLQFTCLRVVKTTDFFFSSHPLPHFSPFEPVCNCRDVIFFFFFFFPAVKKLRWLACYYIQVTVILFFLKNVHVCAMEYCMYCTYSIHQTIEKRHSSFFLIFHSWWLLCQCSSCYWHADDTRTKHANSIQHLQFPWQEF